MTPRHIAPEHDRARPTRVCPARWAPRGYALTIVPPPPIWRECRTLPYQEIRR
jgi:hypothetical protein